nr:retrovirus-related Pol polyprotein from transposon TNT 1-94 [Tanacetum cinerariifolium]
MVDDMIIEKTELNEINHRIKGAWNTRAVVRGRRRAGLLAALDDQQENQTGRTVKKLRTDNGLEICNQEFKQLCIESRIARYLTVAGTPQQNGLAKCMNKTLMDK